MHTVFVLAHGALGDFDELIFLSIAAIFLIMMGIAWVRSLVSTPPALEEPTDSTPTPTTDTDERFPLD
ncbi:MAG: hypothetical protein H0X30_09880 [Anaerolineae bacterium]|nr:hypothetical protein [Anaerolineae bacterium]